MTWADPPIDNHQPTKRCVGCQAGWPIKIRPHRVYRTRMVHIEPRGSREIACTASL